MLSRTASELFWMARYLERAESYARVLDVTWKLSMIPRHSQQSRDLALPLNLSMTHELFQARHARFTMSNLLNFFALDGNNPCSIYSCVEMAWNNAHAVRGSLSAEVWESINATRIELRSLRQQGLGELGSDGFFEWVKERVHLFRGAVIGTLLRNDALSFIGIGTLIERAFATTQLLLGGGTDAICEQAYQEAAVHMPQVVAELRALNPDAQIILLGYTNPVPLLPEWTQLFRRLNALSKSLAAQNENVTYVPIPFAMTAADAHPTVSGHKYIANRILRAIKK